MTGTSSRGRSPGRPRGRKRGTSSDSRSGRSSVNNVSSCNSVSDLLDDAPAKRLCTRKQKGQQKQEQQQQHEDQQHEDQQQEHQQQNKQQQKHEQQKRQQQEHPQHEQQLQEHEDQDQHNELRIMMQLTSKNQQKILVQKPENRQQHQNDDDEELLIEVPSTQLKDDHPEEILGLETLIVETPEEDLASDLETSVEEIEEESQDEELTEVEELSDEEEQSGEEGEEEEEEEEEQQQPPPQQNPEEFINKLLNDSMSLSEVAALMDTDDEESEELSGTAPTPAPPPPPLQPVATSAGNDASKQSSGSSGGRPTNLKQGYGEDHRHKPAAEKFEIELSEQQRQQMRGGGGGGGRNGGRGRGRGLNPTLAGLMGEANLRVVCNELDSAIVMCLEIIRQFRNSPLPYETLAMIYEEKGMKHKSLQFQLIAAFLSPMPDKWVDLADHYESQDEVQQAVYCYSRAIRASPRTLAYHWSRVALLERLNEPNKALRCYAYMIKFLQPHQGKDGLKLAKEIAKIHFSRLEHAAARQSLETAFLRYPDAVTHEDVNLLLEVLATLGDHAACLDVLATYAGVKFIHREKASPSSPSSVQSLSSSQKQDTSLAVTQRVGVTVPVRLHAEATECWLPEDLPIDLRSKLTVCLIRSAALTLAQPLVRMLMSEPTIEFGDLYLDAAEAYLSVAEAAAALPLLRRLLACPRHRAAAAAWRCYSQALLACHGAASTDAIAACYKLVEHAPEDASARLSLASLLQDAGQQDEALQLLREHSGPLHCQVLYRRCLLLFEDIDAHEDEFVATATLLLRRHCVHIRSRDEAEVLVHNKKASNKFESLRELRRSKGESIEDEEPRYASSLTYSDGSSSVNASTGCGTTPVPFDVPIRLQWDVFVKACKVLFRAKRFAELERLTCSALGSREFLKEQIREVEFLCLQAAIANNDSYLAYDLMRDIVVRHPTVPRVWNLLNQIIIRADDFRHNRFLLRLSEKYPDCLALSMLNGHNCLVAGTYKYSLAEYMKVFKKKPTDPLASLMLGLTYIHMACQKFSADKNTLVTQAWVFLNTYRELRGDCQESLYNIGRAMHQLNVLHQAIHYYELALECTKPVQKVGEPSFDLTNEIAFNLALLYRKGSEKLSRYYIRNYITV